MGGVGGAGLVGESRGGGEGGGEGKEGLPLQQGAAVAGGEEGGEAAEAGGAAGRFAGVGSRMAALICWSRSAATLRGVGAADAAAEAGAAPPPAERSSPAVS